MPTYTPSTAEVTENMQALTLAKAKYNNRDYLGALTAYSDIIRLNPRDAQAVCARGVTYYRLDDLQNAAIDYSRAIELDPTFAIAYYRRGFLHYTAKNYVAAIADYNMSIDLNPTFALAYSNRGYVYRDLYGEQEAAIDWRFAAKLFKEQGNLTKHESMMKLLNKISDNGSWASGMLY